MLFGREFGILTKSRIPCRKLLRPSYSRSRSLRAGTSLYTYITFPEIWIPHPFFGQVSRIETHASLFGIRREIDIFAPLFKNPFTKACVSYARMPQIVRSL